ncbi:YoaK family protein [Alteromonas facilis]|uniref:YoaK family protein n=1 Tax=Alteromonas facilis TaxID=2048004 RepID=UPI000C294162|nr:YoaK family protein [Alteromonas facilis]
MITQLPKWVEIGAFTLALVAGIVNAVGLLGFEHQSVSHVSGSATIFGTQLLSANSQMLVHLMGVLLSFLLGAALAGVILHGSSLKFGRHYDSALLIEALLLLVSLWLLSNGSFYGHFFASAACGLQNALATTYSGAIIRTTHLTGIFTDLGIMLGAFIRGEAFDKRKGILFLIIIVGFILGGSAGAYLFAHLQFMALLVPAMICFIMAIIYRLYANAQGAS